jgi:predicted AAA+ superfamily ATPase
MYRTAIEELHTWKAKADKKPLIIRGARQVGKTWLMKEFGKTAFEKTVYINFDNNRRMKDLFSADLDVPRLVTGIELYSGQKIYPANTLLLFDEVQEVPKALTSLKYVNLGSVQD